MSLAYGNNSLPAALTTWPQRVSTPVRVEWQDGHLHMYIKRLPVLQIMINPDKNCFVMHIVFYHRSSVQCCVIVQPTNQVDNIAFVSGVQGHSGKGSDLDIETVESMLRENSAASQLSKQSQASTRPLLNVWAGDGRPARSFARSLGQRQQQQYTTILLHSHTKLSPTHALCACITARRVLAESESLVIRHTWGPGGLLSVKTSPQRRADLTDEFAPVTWDVMAQSTKLLILCDSQRVSASRQQSADAAVWAWRTNTASAFMSTMIGCWCMSL